MSIKLKRECAFCSSEFMTYPSHDKKYCSKDCADRHSSYKPRTEAQKAGCRAAALKLHGRPCAATTRAKISSSLMGHSVTYELSDAMKKKAKDLAQFRWEGGEIGKGFAEILCPAGYVRELYFYYGEHIVPLAHGVMRRRFIRLDFAHVDAKIDIELDGVGHDDPEQVFEDARRDTILIEAGWRVVRVNHGAKSVFSDEMKDIAKDAARGVFPEAK